MLCLLTVIASFFCAATATSELDNDRIIGGRTVNILELPYQVSLQNGGYHFCGGSILSNTVILTAAHCINGVKDSKMSQLTIRCGSSMWSRGGQVRNIVDMKAHPKYNATSKEADIGVIIVSPPIKYESGVKNIQMANGVPTDGKIGIISGWGVTKEKGVIPTMLKVAEVTSISRKNCSQPPWDYGSAIKPSMICATAEGKDACQGDSGGPYVSKDSGKLWGVVSWGRGCAQPGLPGVYVAVVAFKKWITKFLENY